MCHSYVLNTLDSKLILFELFSFLKVQFILLGLGWGFGCQNNKICVQCYYLSFWLYDYNITISMNTLHFTLTAKYTHDVKELVFLLW